MRMEAFGRTRERQRHGQRGVVQIEREDRAPRAAALHGGATIEHGEIGDAARTIDLDVFGARLERHGGANARRMRFQSAELSAMTHEIQQHDGAESAQHGERPAGAFEPNHVSRTPGSNVTIVT